MKRGRAPRGRGRSTSRSCAPARAQTLGASDPRARARGSGRARPRRPAADRAARRGRPASARRRAARCTSAMSGSSFGRARRRCASSGRALPRRTAEPRSRRPGRSPGSRSASSGNSRSSDRQNASIVLIEISAETIAQRDPARPVELRQRGRPAQLADDPLAHLGRGLAGEGDRQDVGRLDARLEQVDVALHQHGRLAGAGGRLEHDVVARIDRERTARARRRPAASTAARRIEERQLTHRRRSPCGRRRRSRTTGSGTARRAAPGTRRARWRRPRASRRSCPSAIAASSAEVRPPSGTNGFLFLERDVAGAADRPRAAAVPLERLLRDHAVDRQLQRARQLWAPCPSL